MIAIVKGLHETQRSKIHRKVSQDVGAVRRRGDYKRYRHQSIEKTVQ